MMVVIHLYCLQFNHIFLICPLLCYLFCTLENNEYTCTCIGVLRTCMFIREMHATQNSMTK